MRSDRVVGVVTALVAVTAAVALLSDIGAQAQSSSTAKRFPVFEVDESWPPKLPNKWVL